MKLEEFKKKINKLSETYNVDAIMPVIPTLEDYTQLYEIIEQNIKANVANEILDNQMNSLATALLNHERDLINKYAKSICTVSFESLHTLEEKRKALNIAYALITKQLGN